MTRCSLASLASFPSLLCWAALLAAGPMLAVAADSGSAPSATSSTSSTQQQYLSRRFPADALRGKAVFGTPPELTLNGQAVRLAPGAHVRGLNNMLVMSGSLAGVEAKINYTVDTYGLVKDVWILRDDEIAHLWPTTAAQAAAWSFDPIGQTWTKP